MIGVGIDSGKAGAIVALHENGLPAYVGRAKDWLRATGKGAKRDYAEGAMYQALVGVRAGFLDETILVVLEAGTARPGQGVTSMFSIGLGLGIWRGVLAASGLSYELVHPATWTTRILKGAPGEGKARAIGVVERRLPRLEIIPPGSKKPDEGIADAACLALYALHRLGVG